MRPCQQTEGLSRGDRRAHGSEPRPVRLRMAGFCNEQKREKIHDGERDLAREHSEVHRPGTADDEKRKGHGAEEGGRGGAQAHVPSDSPRRRRNRRDVGEELASRQNRPFLVERKKKAAQEPSRQKEQKQRQKIPGRRRDPCFAALGPKLEGKRGKQRRGHEEVFVRRVDRRRRKGEHCGVSARYARCGREGPARGEADELQCVEEGEHRKDAGRREEGLREAGDERKEHGEADGRRHADPGEAVIPSAGSRTGVRIKEAVWGTRNQKRRSDRLPAGSKAPSMGNARSHRTKAESDRAPAAHRCPLITAKHTWVTCG